MLLVVLIALGFLIALAGASMFRRPRGRLALAVVGILIWAGYTIYIGTIASCPEHGECDKWLGVILVGAVVVAWLAGVGVSWVVRRPTAA